MNSIVFPLVSRRQIPEGRRGRRPDRHAAIPRSAWADEEKRLNFYNWDTYIGETTIETFTDKTGVAVQSDLFANNEELFAKLKEGNPGYDVIVPSDYMVQTMITLGIIDAARPCQAHEHRQPRSDLYAIRPTTPA